MKIEGHAVYNCYFQRAVEICIRLRHIAGKQSTQLYNMYDVMLTLIFFFSNFIHIIVTFTSQSKQYKYIQQQQITYQVLFIFWNRKKRVLLEKK